MEELTELINMLVSFLTIMLSWLEVTPFNDAVTVAVPAVLSDVSNPVALTVASEFGVQVTEFVRSV